MQQYKNTFILEVKPGEFKGQMEELRKELRKNTAERINEFTEITIDLESYLPRWNLRSLSEGLIGEEFDKNCSLLEELDHEDRIKHIEKETINIWSSNMYKLCGQRDKGEINNWWSNNDGTGLKQAMRKGAVAVTTNPKIVNELVKRFPGYWGEKRQDIKKRFRGSSLEQIAARMTTEVVLESARLLRGVYKAGDRHIGYTSLQLNPNLSDNSETMLKDANMIYSWLREDFKGEEPNVIFKVPGTFAGLDTARELTKKGIGVNITVNYSVAQQLAFGKILEGGNARHCYLTQMNRRLEEPVADELGEGACDSPEKISSWASTAVTRRAYKMLYGEKTYKIIYGQKGYKKSILLGASINQPWHVQRVITGGNDYPMHMTIAPEELAGFEERLGKLNPCISKEIRRDIIEGLLKSETFRKAYEPDSLKSEEFDKFKPTLKTLDGFKKSYNEFCKWCGE